MAPLKTFNLSSRHLISFVTLVIGVSFLASCTKKAENTGSSVISLSVPDVDGAGKGTKGSEKVGAFAAIPANRRACFGINITADDIPSLAGTTCSPKTGIVAGFVESGGTIQVEVPRGENRTFELFLYLKAENDTTPCPVMGKVFAAADLSKIYNLGATTGVPIRKAVEDVTITASFPGLTQTIAAVNSMPATCTAVAAPSTPPHQRISSDAGVAVGGGMKLMGRVGDVKGTPLTGGGVRLKSQ